MTEQIDHIGLLHATHRRMERAEALCNALGDAHPDDAKAITAAYLDAMRAGDPQPHDPFGDLRNDAAFWADCAHPGELEAYFAASLKRIGDRALGIRARKRLFAALWESFDTADRVAFLRRVDADGRFHGRAV